MKKKAKRKSKPAGFCQNCPQRNARHEVPRLTAGERMKYASNCAWLKREGECGRCA